MSNLDVETGEAYNFFISDNMGLSIKVIFEQSSFSNKYYKDIFKEIMIICENPEIGKSIKEIKPNHRTQLIKSHLIVYKALEDKIYIDRIFHKRMDIENILSIDDLH